MIYDPKHEKMPRRELQELQLERLRATVKRVYERVPFYRNAFMERGIAPEDIRSLEDLRRLPFTSKLDFRDNYPFGLTAVQVGVMYVVRMLNSKGVQTSPSEISRWVFREPHTTSALLHRMEKQGLVKLKRISRANRQLRAELTEKGEELYRRQVEARQVIPEILDVLSPEAVSYTHLTLPTN